MSINIRKEQPRDAQSIHEVTVAAFLEAPHTDHTEQFIVKGIGSKLMSAAIQELKNIKAKGCVLLGDPDYYLRFGFKPGEGLVLPGVSPEYFQALVFQGDLPQGSVTYHESFSAKG